MRFSGKRILITGANSSIGAAIVKQLAAEGATLALHWYQNEASLIALVESIAEHCPDPVLLYADLSKREDVLKMAEKTWSKLGGVDALINNAGLSQKKNFLDYTAEEVEALTDINFKGTLYLTQSIAGKMVGERIEGSILTITSINGLQPGIGHAVYGATKGAQETLMKGIALELAPYNIRVNTVAPGAIQSENNAPVWQDQVRLALVNENIPMQRIGKPEEVASLICNLLSADSYMTGACITVDGGWLLKHGYEKLKDNRHDRSSE